MHETSKFNMLKSAFLLDVNGEGVISLVPGERTRQRILPKQISFHSFILKADVRSKLAIPTYAKSRIGITGALEISERSCMLSFFVVPILVWGSIIPFLV